MKYEPVSTMLHSTHYYLWNMNQCPQCSTQLIITYEIGTSVHNAALNSLLLKKYEPVSTMQNSTHYYLRNMNQCSQCSTQLIITYEIWTSVHNAALNSLLLTKYELVFTIQYWTHLTQQCNITYFTNDYDLRNMNQCPQCSTEHT